MKPVVYFTILWSLLQASVANPIPDTAVTNVTSIEDNPAAYEAALAKWNKDHKLDKRSLAHTVFMCKEPNWKGQCTNVDMSSFWNQQINRPFTPIGSFGPSKPLACIWYNYQCTAFNSFGFPCSTIQSDTVYSPGSNNLGWWEWNLQTYKCWW